MCVSGFDQSCTVQVVDELIRISDQQRRAIVAHLQRRSAAIAAATAAREQHAPPPPTGQHPTQNPPSLSSVPPSRNLSAGSLALLTPSMMRSPADSDTCLSAFAASASAAEPLSTLREESGEIAGAQDVRGARLAKVRASEAASAATKCQPPSLDDGLSERHAHAFAAYSSAEGVVWRAS